MVSRKVFGASAAALLAAAACFTLGAGAGLALAPGTHLYINGTLASSRVFQHNGAACVPVADVAKALNLVVTAKADGYALAAAGGANAVGGLSGKIGDTLTNGQLTVTVLKAARQDKYVFQYTKDERDANDASEDVVSVTMRVKNATAKEVEIINAGGDLTSLTDQDSHAYRAFAQDNKSGWPHLLPGAASDFVLLFRVPKSEKLGDLVYQTSAFDNTIKKTTMRISLASANAE